VTHARSRRSHGAVPRVTVAPAAKGSLKDFRGAGRETGRQAELLKHRSDLIPSESTNGQVKREVLLGALDRVQLAFVAVAQGGD